MGSINDLISEASGSNRLNNIYPAARVIDALLQAWVSEGTGLPIGDVIISGYGEPQLRTANKVYCEITLIDDATEGVPYTTGEGVTVLDVIADYDIVVRDIEPKHETGKSFVYTDRNTNSHRARDYAARLFAWASSDIGKTKALNAGHYYSRSGQTLDTFIPETTWGFSLDQINSNQLSSDLFVDELLQVRDATLEIGYNQVLVQDTNSFGSLTAYLPTGSGDYGTVSQPPTTPSADSSRTRP